MIHYHGLLDLLFVIMIPDCGYPNNKCSWLLFEKEIHMLAIISNLFNIFPPFGALDRVKITVMKLYYMYYEPNFCIKTTYYVCLDHKPEQWLSNKFSTLMVWPVGLPF